MRGKIFGLHHKFIVVIYIPITNQMFFTEIKMNIAVSKRLRINKRVVFYKSYWISVTVFFFAHWHETTGDACTGITFLPQFFVKCLLTNKFIQPVISIVITDEKNSSD